MTVTLANLTLNALYGYRVVTMDRAQLWSIGKLLVSTHPGKYRMRYAGWDGFSFPDLLLEEWDGTAWSIAAVARD